MNKEKKQKTDKQIVVKFIILFIGACVVGFVGGFGSALLADKFDGDNDIHAGFERFAFEVLTGAKGYAEMVNNWTDERIKEFNNPNRISTVSAQSGDKKLTTASGEEITLYDEHAYAVVGSDDNCVYLVNPHDSSKILAIPIETFKEFFECVEYCDL